MYTAENVKTLYRGGRIFILQFSHGAETAFYKLSKFDYRWIKVLDTSYLSSLPNSSQLPVVIAPACSSGAFDYDIFNGRLRHSLGQAVIFSNAGGIAYVGMSRIAFGALSFYFDRGVLKIPILLFAQAILKDFFKAYYYGARVLGDAYVECLQFYALENDMNYWINIRTLLECVLIGDPLIPLPNITESEEPPIVEPLEKTQKTITIPLTFGEAMYYDEDFVCLNVCDDGVVKYILISPMIPETYSKPLISTNFSEPEIIGFNPPAGGLYVLRIIDSSGKEQRVYIRGRGAEFIDAELEILDTDGNSKYEFIRLNVTVYFNYFSKTTTVWGFRAWMRFSYAGEEKYRINQNRFIKAQDVGTTTLSFMFDAGPLLGGKGILNIDFFFFSWWPYLFTWWFSGPSIWTEFAIRLITRIPENSLERAIDISLENVDILSLDFDPGVEAAVLYFRIRAHCGFDGNLEAMLYLQRRIIGDRGGVVYYLSSFRPYIIPTYKKDVLIRYVWGLKAWYAKGSWGVPPPEENASITYHYSFIIDLRLRNIKLRILSTRNVRIEELDNITADTSTNKSIIIEKVNVSEIYSSEGQVMGVLISFTGYSRYPHFERTEFILEKYEDGSWVTIIQKELTMGIFIFFWPAQRTTFQVCYIPIEKLGNGTFRVTVRAFKYVGGRKKILAENYRVFTIDSLGGSTIRSIDAMLLDIDSDNVYGHLLMHLELARKFETVSINYKLYWLGDGVKTKFSSGKATRYFEGSITLTVGVRGENLAGLENISIMLEVSIAVGKENLLFLVPYTTSFTLIENASGRDFESPLMDYDKKLCPIIFVENLPNVLATHNISLRLHISAIYSTQTNLSVLINDTPILGIENITGYSLYTLNISVDLEGFHILSFDISFADNRLFLGQEFIVDLSKPKLMVNVETPYKKLLASWSASDLSGVKRVEFYANDTLIYSSPDRYGKLIYSLPEGFWIIKITAIDNAGWSTTVEKEAFIDCTPPTIKLISPKTTNISLNESVLNIVIEASDSSGIKCIRLAIDFGETIYITHKENISIELVEGTHIISITAIDNANNEQTINLRVYVSKSNKETNSKSNNTTTMKDQSIRQYQIEQKDKGSQAEFTTNWYIISIVILFFLTIASTWFMKKRLI